MKLRLIVMLAVLALFAGAARAQFVNRIGIYSSPTPSNLVGSFGNYETNVHTPAPGFLDVYVVCVNPCSGSGDHPITTLGGFEFNLAVQEAWYLAEITLPENILDLDAADDAFYCSGLVPVTASNGHQVALLATLRLMHIHPAPGLGIVYLAPYFVAPSIPGHMAITDADNNFELQAAEPSSGDYGLPVFYINYFWDAPEERSWGDVQALYR